MFQPSNWYKSNEPDKLRVINYCSGPIPLKPSVNLDQYSHSYISWSFGLRKALVVSFQMEPNMCNYLYFARLKPTFICIKSVVLPSKFYISALWSVSWSRGQYYGFVVSIIVTWSVAWSRGQYHGLMVSVMVSWSSWSSGQYHGIVVSVTIRNLQLISGSSSSQIDWYMVCFTDLWLGHNSWLNSAKKSHIHNKYDIWKLLLFNHICVFWSIHKQIKKICRTMHCASPKLMDLACVSSMSEPYDWQFACIKLTESGSVMFNVV